MCSQSYIDKCLGDGGGGGAPSMCSQSYIDKCLGDGGGGGGAPCM